MSQQSELMRTGVRYVLTFNNSASHLRYRESDKESGPFDYYRIGGHQGDSVTFILNHRVMVVEADMHADVRLNVTFDAARSGLFRDFCNAHLAAIELEGGKAFMRFYDNEWSPKASFEVPMQLVRK
ncbi:hypothetical protein [Pseudomonas serbica]|uniref:hypothetical protein n=1 Tax=Pseudomonas serbica TaxID=2965074 RepID=UPI00237B168D|nr:hypothetical protein [Pseudomonas serbica]